MKIGIIAVGYNRPDSMRRLATSLTSAYYYGYNVDLIFSIDKGQKQSEIVKIAQECDWKYGQKIIRAFQERQGLRNHILQCGDMTKEYDAVVVLEDDLIVSKYYFKYIIKTLEWYKDDDKIAGISLYTHQTHPGVRRPFEAVNNGYDVYMMQFAMSWGQCWSRKMWLGFRKWYLENENSDLSLNDLLPKYISNWNKQSWLKYYMRYIVENDKFFIYPYIALSTNASDIGEHCSIPNNDYQIAILQGEKEYKFPTYEQSIKYDVFFERLEIQNIVFPYLKGSKILDLYGNRIDFQKADYIVSTRVLPYKIVDEYALKYRPIEMNCIIPTKGKGIYIYDSRFKSNNKRRNDIDVLTRYEVRAIHWKRLLHFAFTSLIDAFRRKILKVK